MMVRIFVASLLYFAGSGALMADYDASALQQLFTDKKQRAQIDAARSGKGSSVDVPHTSQVKVSGYVTRSDGKSVVWLNNKNTLKTSKLGDVRVQESTIGKNKKVTLIVDGKKKQLSPGEIWHKDSGKVVENH